MLLPPVTKGVDMEILFPFVTDGCIFGITICVGMPGICAFVLYGGNIDALGASVKTGVGEIVPGIVGITCDGADGRLGNNSGFCVSIG